MKKLWELGMSLYKKYRETIAYLFFGVVATLLNIVLYYVLTSMVGLSTALGNIVDTIICVLFQYFTNRIWVFRSKNRGMAAVREFLQFMGCRAVTAVIDEAIMIVGVDYVVKGMVPAGLQGIAGVGVKVLANVIVIVLNYVFSKLIVFSKKSKIRFVWHGEKRQRAFCPAKQPGARIFGYAVDKITLWIRRILL